MKKIFYILALGMMALGADTASAYDAAQLFEMARQADKADDYVTSLSLYLKADSAYVVESKAETAEYAQSLHNTGIACFKTDDMAQGREYTLKAAQLREKLFGKVSKEYITSLNNYALSYLMADEPDNALRYQTEVVELCRKMTSPAHPDEGMYIINLGRVYHQLGNDAEAVKLMEEALPKVEKFSTNYEYILNFLGMVYMEQDDNENTNRILGLMDEHNRHELEKECDAPECHLDRAEYYLTTGDVAHAKDEFMAVFALPLTDRQKETAYNKYAKFLSSQRDFSLAADYYIMASEASVKANGISESAIMLTNLAGAHYFIGSDFDKSVEAYLRVVEAVDRNGYSERLKGTALKGLGNAYNAKRDYDKAITTFGQWRDHLKANGHAEEKEYAEAYERIATAERFGGDYTSSIADYDTAIELFGRLGLYDEQQQAADAKARCQASANKAPGNLTESEAASRQREEKIKATLTESLNGLEQGGDYLGKLSKARSLATIAGCYALLEDYANAVSYYEKYLPAVREALAEDFLLKNPKERELTWQTELTNISEMSAMIVNLPQNPGLYGRLSRLIYDGQLLSKGILLSSSVEFDKVLRANGSEVLQRQYDAVKAGLLKIEEMKRAHKPAAEILELIRATDNMQLSLAREAEKLGVYTDFLNITADDVVKSLGNDGAAIEFVTLDTDVLPGNKMIAAVVVSDLMPDGITVPVCRVRDVRAMLADKNKFADSGYAEKIWGRIANVIAGKSKVYFAPDGILNNIGIEYLTSGGIPAGDIFNLSRVSSTREVARQQSPVSLQYAALFGDIDYLEEGSAASDKHKFARNTRDTDGLGFSTLANTGREIDGIRALLKKSTKKIFAFKGTKASKEEFMSLKDVPVNILHIATHGKYIAHDKQPDADAMANSILAFAGANLYTDLAANEGVVTAAEIAGMTLHDCDLVVLSACESGLGKLADDGVFGLQRGFKNAGVKSLLVSLNEVYDRSTADMMIAFYRNLLDGSGMTKREALSKAQAEIRAAYPADDTWASFILIDAFN